MPANNSRREAKWIVYENSSHQKKKIILPDSTLLMLSGKSQVSFRETVAVNKREVKMEGQAYFDVHKDQSKPFTVYAGNTATTALGTAFCINMVKGKVTIKLFSGKVKINPVRLSISSWASTVYLLPGEQLQYDVSGEKTTKSVFSKKIHRIMNHYHQRYCHSTMSLLGKYLKNWRRNTEYLSITIKKKLPGYPLPEQSSQRFNSRNT